MTDPTKDLNDLVSGALAFGDQQIAETKRDSATNVYKGLTKLMAMIQNGGFPPSFGEGLSAWIQDAITAREENKPLPELGRGQQLTHTQRLVLHAHNLGRFELNPDGTVKGLDTSSKINSALEAAERKFSIAVPDDATEADRIRALASFADDQQRAIQPAPTPTDTADIEERAIRGVLNQIGREFDVQRGSRNNTDYLTALIDERTEMDRKIDELFGVRRNRGENGADYIVRAARHLLNSQAQPDPASASQPAQQQSPTPATPAGQGQQQRQPNGPGNWGTNRQAAQQGQPQGPGAQRPAQGPGGHRPPATPPANQQGSPATPAQGQQPAPRRGWWSQFQQGN